MWVVGRSSLNFSSTILCPAVKAGKAIFTAFIELYDLDFDFPLSFNLVDYIVESFFSIPFMFEQLNSPPATVVIC
jgi:hypothetical protein